ncbi:MAG: hypothetical protein M3323_03180 [Actinomycetota bacterium]|nr:hypothetical protein [Actinomycetota bacterium]
MNPSWESFLKKASKDAAALRYAKPGASAGTSLVSMAFHVPSSRKWTGPLKARVVNEPSSLRYVFEVSVRR